MIVSLLVATLASATPLTVTLPSQHQWALVTALERRVGGRFILTGLKDGERVCRDARVCVAGSQIEAAVSDPAAVRSVDQLLSSAQVNGDDAVALVSLRGARQLGRGRAEVLASVYDANRRQWVGYAGVLGGLTNLDGTGGGLTGSVKLMTWDRVDGLAE